MYLPRWSNEILDELRRTLLEKLGPSPEQVDHLLNELNRHFADARVEAFETLVAVTILPNFTVAAQPDRSYYLPGQNASVAISANYLFGEEVTHGAVKLVLHRR
jgi:hypothetical protein